MNKEILNINDNGQYHGYNEWYTSNKVWYRCVYKNGAEIGYEEINILPYKCIGDIGTKVNFYIK